MTRVRTATLAATLLAALLCQGAQLPKRAGCTRVVDGSHFYQRRKGG